MSILDKYTLQEFTINGVYSYVGGYSNVRGLVCIHKHTYLIRASAYPTEKFIGVTMSFERMGTTPIMAETELYAFLPRRDILIEVKRISYSASNQGYIVGSVYVKGPLLINGVWL